MRGNFITDRKGINNPKYKDGRKNTRLYRIYYGMKARCYNSNNPQYKYYGARGITICKEWLADYINFKEWAINNGYRDNLSIDRIDVNGNYEPNNCRWATHYIQSNNTRRNHKVTIFNETHTLKEWADKFNINPKTVRDRLLRGWSYERAFTTPIDVKYHTKGAIK